MCGNTTALQGDLARFGAVIDQIYQCALEPTAWPRTLVAIADWLESKNAVLYTPLEPKESDRFVLFSHGFSAQSTEIWRGKHTELDVWTHVAAQRQLPVQVEPELPPSLPVLERFGPVQVESPLAGQRLHHPSWVLLEPMSRSIQLKSVEQQPCRS